VSPRPLSARSDPNAPQEKTSLFDHLIGTQQQVGGNFMADGFCGLQIDDQLELGWLFDREIGRLCAAQPKPDSCAIQSGDTHLV
jgi:hypothetical protein